MALMEDYLLFARMVDAGARPANLAEPLVCYRVGAGAYARRGGRQLLRSELAAPAPVPASSASPRADSSCATWPSVGGYRLVPGDSPQARLPRPDRQPRSTRG